MRRSAWTTFGKRENLLAQRRARAMGYRAVSDGLRFKDGPPPQRVIYCAACKGPVVDDEVGHRRHALKNAACKAAMDSL